LLLPALVPAVSAGLRLSVRVSFRFRPLLRPFAVVLLAGLVPLLWPFRLHDDGLVPRAVALLTGLPVLPFTGLLLLPFTGPLWLPFVRAPLLEPVAECVLFPFVLPALFELHRGLLPGRAALAGREPLAGRAGPADRVPPGLAPPSLATPGLAVGVRASLLARRAGLFADEDCPGFRFRDGVAGRLKCGRAPADFPLAADCRTAGVRGVWLEP